MGEYRFLEQITESLPWCDRGDSSGLRFSRVFPLLFWATGLSGSWYRPAERLECVEAITLYEENHCEKRL